MKIFLAENEGNNLLISMLFTVKEVSVQLSSDIVLQYQD